MPDFLCYFNGAWIPRSQCKVSIADRGFVLGDAIYEAERTFGVLALNPVQASPRSGNSVVWRFARE